jgi:hypothetical protein
MSDTAEDERQKIAKEALKILGRKEIPEGQNPIEILKSIEFVMISSIEFDIYETTRKILDYLDKNDTKSALSLLDKLKDLVAALDWE